MYYLQKINYNIMNNLINSLPKQIADIYNDFEEYCKSNEDSTYSREWEIQGWVRDFRSQSINAFISIYDGSCSENFQILCSMEILSKFDNIRGSTIKVRGIVIKSPAKGQLIEMICTELNEIGVLQDKNSIILAKLVNLETLRGYQHLRSRFRTFGYIYKIRSELLKHIHDFFHLNRFYNLDPNIITTSDCEGAGEVFTITTIDSNELINKINDEYNELSNEKTLLSNIRLQKNIYQDDFFKKQAFLTVSSQLQLEALASGLSRVYTLNPSFRAEKSKTKRHLGCFTHLEWEIAFINLTQLMDFSEDLVTYIINKTLETCKKEYIELDKFTSKGIINKLQDIVSKQFERITYDYAIELIEINKKNILKKYSKEITIKDIPVWGDDLGSYCEKYICDEIYNKPVFVYNYPKDLKSFYMKINEDSKTVQACDLLMPNLGELIGSSIREDSHEELIKRMNEKSMDISKLEWYIQLRENSTFEHGGAGLGFDRLVNFCSLMDGNIRDVVPFPVSYEECNY